MEGLTWGIIGGLIGLFGTIFGIYSNMRKIKTENKAENRNEGQQIGTVLTELGYIKSSVDDIKRKQDLADKRHIELVTQIATFDQWKRGTDKRLSNIETNVHNIETEIYSNHHHQ